MLPRSMIVTAYLVLVSFAEIAGQAASARPVMEAIEAQVEGPGGCSGIDAADSIASRFFPEVTLLRGRCVAEHGDTLVAIAGNDRIGLIYLLDSPASFRFLINRHSPVGIDSSSAVDYAYQALALMGELPDGAKLVRDLTVLSHLHAKAWRSKRLKGPPSGVVTQLNGRFIVAITVVGQNRLSRYLATINTRKQVTIARVDVWRANPRVH